MFEFHLLVVELLFGTFTILYPQLLESVVVSTIVL